MALGLPLAALAQPARIDPAQPVIPTPQLQYRSAFADYKPYRDVPVANWRALNDALAAKGGSAGGHAGHTMPGIPGMDQTRTPRAEPPTTHPEEAGRHGHPPQGGKQ